MKESVVDEKENNIKVTILKKYNLAFFGLLGLLIFLIYIPAMKAGFYYDDNHTVLTQHLIRDIGFADLLKQIFTMKARSLLTLSYYLNFKMSYID